MKISRFLLTSLRFPSFDRQKTRVQPWASSVVVDLAHHHRHSHQRLRRSLEYAHSWSWYLLVNPIRDLELLQVEIGVEFPMGCPLIFHSSVRHSPTWNLGVARKQSDVCVDATGAPLLGLMHSYSKSLLEVGSCCEVLASITEFVPRRLYLRGRNRYHVV